MPNDPQSMTNALCFAILIHNTQKLRRLLKAGVDPNRQGTVLQIPGGVPRSPAFVAIFCPNSDILKLLYEAGADFNRQYDNQISLLHFALANNTKKEFQTLLECGANPNIQDPDGESILFKIATDSWDWHDFKSFKKQFFSYVIALILWGAEVNLFQLPPLLAELVQDIENKIQIKADFFGLFKQGKIDLAAVRQIYYSDCKTDLRALLETSGAISSHNCNSNFFKLPRELREEINRLAFPSLTALVRYNLPVNIKNYSSHQSVKNTASLKCSIL